MRRATSQTRNTETLSAEVWKQAMIKMWSMKARGHRQKTEKKPLITVHNNDTQDENDRPSFGCLNPAAQNRLNLQGEQRLQGEDQVALLAETLNVVPDADPRDDGSVVHLIQKHVTQQLPKLPADLNKNLQQHLMDVQSTVSNDFLKLGPLLHEQGWMGDLIDQYHRQIFDHLTDLLRRIQTPKNCLELLDWVLHSYPSHELLGHRDLEAMQPLRQVDLLLLTNWVEEAKLNMLEKTQMDLRGSLERILQMERNPDSCHPEEAYTGLYIDAISCINAIPEEARNVSSTLSDAVQEVCFQELLTFVARYITKQTETLETSAKKDVPETILFLQTLKTCKELRRHVQTKDKNTSISPSQEIVAKLENMEAFTLKLLMDVVADLVETHLRGYFRRDNKNFTLIGSLNTCFPKLSWCLDIQKSVVDEAYKLIAHTYVKHLIQTSQRKLTKCWSPNVGRTICMDAKGIHETISNLAPGVGQWNLLLLRVAELLECQSPEAVRLTVTMMHKECLTQRKDLDLLPALLRWKGLARWEVKKVLEDLPGPRPRSESWYSRLLCC